MTTTSTAQRPSTHLFTRLLRELHALIALGKGNSEEADTIRDDMDSLWYALTVQEQDRMGGLSEDLYTLAEGGPRYRDMTPDELGAWRQKVSAAFEQFRGGNVDPALALLRQLAPSGLPRHMISFLQARCWDRLGDLETALVFMREAEKYDPHQAIMVMGLLRRLDRTPEALAYARRIINDATSTPEAVCLAAASLAFEVQEIGEAEARQRTLALERDQRALMEHRWDEAVDQVLVA